MAPDGSPGIMLMRRCSSRKRPFIRHVSWQLLLAIACLPALAGTAPPGTPLPLIPMPANVTANEGQYVVSNETPLRFHGEDSDTAARQFVQLLARSNGPKLTPVAASGHEDSHGIDFVLDPGATSIPAEGYRLDIGTGGVKLVASSEAGLFNGATTLWQLIAAAEESNAGRSIPALAINDAPRFGWRGYMLDSARHFHTVDQVKHILDAMAAHKLNVFHWHLTDDQGWRLEIRKHPRLTDVGACRIPAGDAGIDQDTGKPREYCGYYTQDDIREIVAYAAERHITVVPEIDVPGHATAAIAAYPELGVEGHPLAVSNQRGIHSNLFNVEEETFAFLGDVFAEVVELFPSRYIHIGADEALKDQWKASPRVQERMRELGVADEAALQSWFVQRLEKMLSAHGRRLIGWDEILEGGLPPETTVMSWRGIEGGLEAARLGHDVVMSPVSALYLDYLQTHSPNEPAGRPKLNTLETFYTFEPVPEQLEPTQRQHILGLQANMWTGDTRTFGGVEHNTFPRLAAVAETGWTPAANKDYASFLQRLPEQLRRYDELDVGYARTPFEVITEATLLPGSGDSPQGDARVVLSSPLGYPIRYTLDADAPKSRWLEYSGPLERITLPAKLHTAAFLGDTPLQPAQSFDLSRAQLLQRTDEQLALCTEGGPVLRMEDDGPVEGPRALFNVAIFEPCWSWKQAPLEDITSIEVRAGRLPYMFQLGEEDAKRRFLPAETAYGELDIRINDCEGPRLAAAPLPATPDADGFATVQARLPSPATGFHDLCIRFSGDTRPDMWVLDRITLLPSTPE